MSERRKPDIHALFGAENLPAIDAGIASMVTHPGTSDWLRQALQDAVRRDPVDALKDAELLRELMELRLNSCLLAHGHAEFRNDDLEPE